VTTSFPRQFARTQRFTLGQPRNFAIVNSGNGVLFLRSSAGDDPIHRLWLADLTTGSETLLADPVELADLATEFELPEAERLRRERLRESAAGITSYAVGDRWVAFALGGQLGLVDLEAVTRNGIATGSATGSATESTAGRDASVSMLDLADDGRPITVFDPRPSPDGQRLAYVAGDELHVIDLRVIDADASPPGRLDISTPRRIGGEHDSNISWGSAEFIAAEEMRRMRGFWWAPDGDRLAVCRVDTSAVQEWYIADPGSPGATPRPMRYPAAGTANADVSLWLVDAAAHADDDDHRIAVEWGAEQWPYLADVSWSEAGLILTVQTRDQTRLQVRRARLESIESNRCPTEVLIEDVDTAWVELVAGTPRLDPEGHLVTAADRDGARRLLVDGVPISPVDLQVRSLLGIVADTSDESDEVRYLVTANPIDDATSIGVYSLEPGASPQLLSPADGVHTAVVDGATMVLISAQLDTAGTATVVTRADTSLTITSVAAVPTIEPQPIMLTTTEHRLATAVLLPADHDGRPLPVVLDPYGGPHAARVLQSYNMFLTSQWLADQGFAVVITDGRGTPGRGSAFERALHRDFATAVLADQIDALDDAAAQLGVLDLDRVAIRGWSFGGYLAALAVLRRGDRVHAAVAGAPVTDWRLYDTHYTERYLGHPDTDPEAYERSSLLPDAHRLERPLLLIHGLADDNVVAAHTLELSSALLAAGRHHEVLMLSGVSHMTPQEVVAENLLLHQLSFLRRALGLATGVDHG